MMVDVDGLSRRFGHNIAQYLYVVVLLNKIDIEKLSDAYIRDMVAVTEITSLKLTSAMYHHKIPILITSTISLYTTPFIPHLLLALVTLDKPINITSQDTI